MNLNKIKENVKTTYTGAAEDAGKVILNLIEELEKSQEAFNSENFEAKVAEALKNVKTVPEVFSKLLAEKISKIEESLTNATSKEALSENVKNQIAGAILKANGKAEVENAVNRILVKNDITGLTFGEVTDWSIQTKFEDLNPLWKQFKRVYYTRFMYSTDELNTAAIFAKGYSKDLFTDGTEKLIQQLAVNPKTITPEYIYKRQSIYLADLDAVAAEGKEAEFLKWINSELDKVLIDSIVYTILLGDTVNTTSNQIISFETLNKTASDAFTIVANPATAGTVTIADLRALADNVKNPNGKKKVMVISPSLLTEVSEFVYASGGTVDYRSKEEIAGQVGVDEIITTDILPSDASTAGNVLAEVLIPQGYVYNQRKTLSVTWPEYSTNSINYMKEINAAGGVRDLLSTAILKVA